MITLKDAQDMLSATVEKYGADHRPKLSSGASTCVNVVLKKDDRVVGVGTALGDMRFRGGDVNAELFTSNGWEIAPGCLIGTALIEYGHVTAEELINEGYSGATVNGLTYAFGIQISDSALDYLRNAQRAQDDGDTWGDAKKAADNIL